MQAAFASSIYQDSITDDETKLIRRDRFSTALTERHVRVEGDPGDGCVKLIVLLRGHPARSREAFLEALTGPYSEAVARLGPLRHEQLISLPDGIQAFDAADEIWFADAEAALAHLNSGAADDAAMTLAGFAMGRERLIAAPVLVAGPRLP
jgi:hypothetical protein